MEYGVLDALFGRVHRTAFVLSQPLLQVEVWNFRDEPLDVFWMDFEGNPADVGQVASFQVREL